MIDKWVVPTIALAIAYATPLLAYDLETHARLSEAAAGVSSLSTALTNLQLGSKSPLSVTDITRPTVNKGSALGWIEEGAVREDGESPCDDRVRNHFYNPLNNMGYSFGALTGISSPLWGRGPDDCSLSGFLIQ